MKKTAQPKHYQNITITAKKEKPVPWKDAKPTNPNGVKVQVCPGFTHYTQFDPQPGDVGLGMRDEFKRLTGGK